MSKYEENLKKVTKFCDKHQKNKSYSFDSDLSPEYRDGIRETESHNAIDSIFDYGFMQGYKQKEAELKKERNDMPWYKRRLLDLLKDAPDWADFMFDFLYSFICSAIIKGKFPTIPKRMKEIEQYHAEREAQVKQKETEKQKPLKTDEQIRRDGYKCESMSLIARFKEEDVLRYLFIIIYDLAKERGVDVSDIDDNLLEKESKEKPTTTKQHSDIKQMPVYEIPMMSDDEWNRLAYQQRLAQTQNAPSQN